MSDRLFVGSRKGLFIAERTGSGWELGEPHFVGDPVNLVLQDSRDEAIYAALLLGHFGVKLRRSDDGGSNWVECGVPEYPQADPDAEKGASLDEIWALEGGGDDRPGVLWCGTIPGGLFQSTDRGETWQLNESLWNQPEKANWFGGGKDEPGIHSICVDPRNSRSVTLGVSCGGSWRTDDGGETWQLRAAGMQAAYMPPDRANDESIQDPHLIAQCPSAPDVLWTQHHNGIFKSSNRGEQWECIENAGPSTFGFAVAVHPQDPDRAWFVPAVKDECRVPVDGRFVVTRTSDGGRSFDVLSNGLPQEHAYHLVFRHALAVDETGDRLAMGSSTGGLWITENGGDDWSLISNDLPPVYSVRFGV